MKIKRTYNIQEVEAILKHPSIWKQVFGDFEIASFVLRDKRSDIHLMAYTDTGETIGVTSLVPNIKKIPYVHAHILPEYRKEYAKAICLESINWVWNNTDYSYLRIRIPITFPNVFKFAQKCNAKLINTSKAKLNNKTYKYWVMEINKEEIL